MSRKTDSKRHLFTTSADARALLTRFGHWPEAGEPGVPVFEELPLQTLQQLAAEKLQPHLGPLREAVWALRAGWTKQDEQQDDWSGIAHGLLAGYLLWVVGSALLRRLYQAPVLAVICNDAGSTEGIWFRFTRANGRFGACNLLGSLYRESQQAQQLLSWEETGKALSSLEDDASLLVGHPKALSALLALGGLTSKQADEHGFYHNAWPLLAADRLQSLRPELNVASLALADLMRDALPALAGAAATPSRFQPGDIAFAAWPLAVRLIVDDWLQAEVLPPVIPVHVSYLVR